MARQAKAGANNESLRAWASWRVAGMSIPELDAWLRRHFVYRAESKEVIREIDWMVADYQRDGSIEGDCDDAATFAAFALLVMGHRPRFVAIRYSNPAEFEHVFVEVQANSRIFTVDPTVPRGTRYVVLERMALDVV